VLGKNVVKLDNRTSNEMAYFLLKSGFSSFKLDFYY
jgi:hypothetical protein